MGKEMPRELLPTDGEPLQVDLTAAGLVGRLYSPLAPRRDFPPTRECPYPGGSADERDRESIVCRADERAAPWTPTSAIPDERWSSLLECTSDLVVVIDSEGWITHANHASAGRGRGREDVRGHSIYDFLTPEHHDRMRDGIKDVFETGRTLRQVVCLSRYGSPGAQSEVCMGPVTQNGRTMAVGAFFTDITEREKLRNKLEENEMLIKSIMRAVPKMMDVFDGLVQHGAANAESERKEQELKLYREHLIQIGRLVSVGKASSSLTQRLPQFLTAIGMFIENALAGLEVASGAEGVREDLEAALGAVGALAGGVERVRGFAQTGARRDLVHRVDLRRILVKVVQLLEARARQADTLICIDHLGHLPPVRMAEGDAEQLFFSLIEKIIRSVDGRRHHRTVVSSLAVEHGIELQFSGMCGRGGQRHPTEALEHVFTTEPAVTAADLGLQVAWDIVARAGGRIWSEEVAGGFLTFFVILPSADWASMPAR